MRNLFAFAAVAGLLSFASCGEKKAETSAETTTIDTAAAPAMEAAVDTAMSVVDTAAAMVDTAAHGAADHAAEHAEKM